MDHWTLDSIPWREFDPSAVDPEVLKVVKAAAMTEVNAADYVTYLKRVCGDPALDAVFEEWGEQEIQHGRALGRWAMLADPSFDFEAALERFRAGYRLPLDATASVRGSRCGEMLSRCVVESGTSSFYSALADSQREPVLIAICREIAGDEFRHYKLFKELAGRFSKEEQRLNLLRRLKVAMERVLEVDDDELAYAYYAANARDAKYDRSTFNREYSIRAFSHYRPGHVHRLVGMVSKAIGIPPQGRLSRFLGHLMWWWVRHRSRNFRPSEAT